MSAPTIGDRVVVNTAIGALAGIVESFDGNLYWATVYGVNPGAMNFIGVTAGQIWEVSDGSHPVVLSAPNAII